MGEGLVNRKIDTRGLFCPEPVFRTKVEMARIPTGGTLRVLADDPAAEWDISGWVERSGHRILNFSKEGKDMQFLIMKCK